MFNQKRREVDLKSSKTESKQTELLLNHERERANFKSENDRLRIRADGYLKEIEKLKNDIKNKRNNYFSGAT